MPYRQCPEIIDSAKILCSLMQANFEPMSTGMLEELSKQTEGETSYPVCGSIREITGYDKQKLATLSLTESIGLYTTHAAADLPPRPEHFMIMRWDDEQDTTVFIVLANEDDDQYVQVQTRQADEEVLFSLEPELAPEWQQRIIGGLAILSDIEIT